MSVLLRVLVPTVLLPLAVAAVPARHAAADTGPWTWPLSGTPVVLRAFDPPAQRWLAGHRGVDLAAEPGIPCSPRERAGWVSPEPWAGSR